MKRITSLILCVCLVFSLAGCSLGKTEGLALSLSNFNGIKTGTVGSEINIKLDKDELAEAITKIACIGENDDLDDYEEFKEDNEGTIEEMNEMLENIPENISIGYSGKIDEDKNMAGNVSYKVGKEDGEIEIAVVDETAYVGVEGILDFLNSMYEFAEEFDAASGDIESFEEMFDGYDYLELDSEEFGIDMEDLKETMEEFEFTDEQLKAVAKPIDKLLNKYFSSFITKTEGGYALTLKVGTLEENLLGVCKKIDENPEKFFDALVEIVKVAHKEGIIEEDDSTSIKELLEKLEDLKEEKEDFVEEWKNFDYEEEIEELFGDETWEEIVDVLGNTSIVLTVGGDEINPSASFAINVCVDSNKPCVSLIMDYSIKDEKIKEIKDIYKDKETLPIDELEFNGKAGWEDETDTEFDIEMDTDFDYEGYFDMNNAVEDVVKQPNEIDIGSSDNLHSMFLEFPSVDRGSGKSLMSHYENKFLDVINNIFPDWKNEHISSTEGISDGNVAVYANSDSQDVYNSVNVYAYFAGNYMNVDFSATLNCDNPEDEMNTFAEDVKMLFGFEIDDGVLADMYERITDGNLQSDLKSYALGTIDGVEYSIGYTEVSGGKTMCNITLSANYSYYG